jgi:hypothetical protein
MLPGNTDALDIAEKDENNLFENGAYDENGDYLIVSYLPPPLADVVRSD